MPKAANNSKTQPKCSKSEAKTEPKKAGKKASRPAVRTGSFTLVSSQGQHFRVPSKVLYKAR